MTEGNTGVGVASRSPLLGQIRRRLRLIVDGKDLGIYPEEDLQGLNRLRGILLEEVGDYD